MNADRRERLATIARRARRPDRRRRSVRSARAAGRPARRARARPRRLHFDLLQNDRAELARRLAGGAANDSRTAAAAQAGLRHGDEPLRTGRDRRLSRARLRRARRAAAQGAARAARDRRRGDRTALAGGTESEPARPAVSTSGRRRRASFGLARCSMPRNGSARRFSLAKPSLPIPAATITFGSRSRRWRARKSPKAFAASARPSRPCARDRNPASPACAGTRRTAARRCHGVIARDPYRTVVSEFMLAQTQVDRVVPKFEAFVERFPDFAALARASPADVLREWKGLGYNSRAVRLQRLAKAVVERYGGALPIGARGAASAAGHRSVYRGGDSSLCVRYRRRAGRYQRAARRQSPLLRRRVSGAAGARELDERARGSFRAGRAHDWNSALMDLGATICTARAPRVRALPAARRLCRRRPSTPRSSRMRASRRKRRPPQDSIPFKRTTRYARGRIVDRLRDLPPGERISLIDLAPRDRPGDSGRERRRSARVRRRRSSATVW